MNVDGGRTDPGTDLGLAPSFSDLYAQRPDNSELGAGVNAGLRADMRFGVSDTLTELVWSPQKGVSLRCTDSSTAGGSNYLVRDAGPSSLATLPVPLSTLPGASAVEANMSATVGLEPGSPKGDERDTLNDKPVTNADGIDGGIIRGVGTAGGSSAQRMDEQDRLVVCEGKYSMGPNHVRAEEEARRLDEKFQSLPDTAGGPPVQRMDEKDNLVDCVRVQFGVPHHVPSEVILGSIEGDLQSLPESAKVDAAKMGPSSEYPVRGNQLDSSDIPVDLPLDRPESMAENDLPTPAQEKLHGRVKTAHGMVKRCPLEDERREGTVASSRQSPQSGQMRRHKQKGKEKAFSGGEISRRKSKDEEDESHESVESCNSARLSSRGENPSGYGRELVLGSKRVRRHEPECPGSKLKAKPDSSFVNWISNMVKGLWKMKEDNPETVALAFSVQSHDYETRNQHLVTRFRKDTGGQNTGFQSIFQSIRCLKRKVREEPTLCKDYQTELELPRKILDLEATPISCYSQGPDLHGKEIILKEKQDESTEMRTTPSRERMTDSPDNRRSCAVVDYKERDNMSSHSSPGLGKPNVDCGVPFETKGGQDSGKNNDNLGSLWITRLVSRGPCLPNKLRDADTCEAHEPIANITASIVDDDKDNDTDIDAPVGVSRTNGHKDQSFIQNVSPVLASEAMASVFARRLDAIKQIMPEAGMTALSTATCIFCGKMDHGLHDCSEIVYDELRDLLSNLNAYDAGAKEGASLCIRCFQHNHWAADCPVRSLKRHDANTSGNLDLPCIDKGKGKQDAITRFSASTSGLKELKESLNMPRSDLFGDRALDVSKGVFDAVRMLRLSRSDILKWANSKMPRSQLEGFFLRLRVGKWEEGLGGTGYHVACITGASVKDLPEHPRSLIPVTVGGLNCVVESQYISNRDFDEEELRAWWVATAKHGGKVPSEEDLRQKLNQRRVLGL